MNTKIYKSYSKFLSREDKKENGVSESFAENNPNFIKGNNSNEASWNCSDCSGCSGLLYKSNINNSELLEIESHYTSPTFAGISIPVIPGIHQKILEAIKAPNHELAMND